MTSSVQFSQCLPVRIAEWLVEHGYAPGDNKHGDQVWGPCEVDYRSKWIGVLHGRRKPFWFWEPGRRVVGCIHLEAEQRWKVSIFGDDGPAAFFKRQLEGLASVFGVEIEATQTTTENVTEARGI